MTWAPDNAPGRGDVAVGAAPARHDALAPRPRLHDDWQRSPWNRWSFQHVSELVPTARVARGERPPLPMPAAPVNLDSLPVDTSVGRVPLHELLARSETDGLVVLHRGALVLERYDHGMRRDTPHLLQSVSKSLTGALAGALAGRGELDTNAPVTGYVTELRDTSFEGVTVRHLLDMTAGTRFNEDYDDPDADVNVYERAAGWRPLEGGPDDLLSYMATLGNDHGHGETFQYRSILTDTLAVVLERAAGRRLADALSALIWAPLGMEQDALVAVDRAGYPMADGGISATTRDLARFGQLLVQGGCVDGRQLLPSHWVADTRWADADCRRTFLASEEASKLAICEPAATVCYATGHYRNQWWVPDPEDGVLLGSGIYGQVLYIDLARAVVVAKVSSQSTPFDADLSTDVLRGCAAVAAALAD